MKQLWTFIRKEFFHVFRDPKTMLLLFGMPIIQIVLFGFALTNEIKNSDVAILDFAHDAVSQRITEKLDASDHFVVKHQLRSEQEIEALYKRSFVKLTVVFPVQLEEQLAHGKRAQIRIIADASDPNTATTLTSFANAVVQDYMAERGLPASMPLQIIPEVRMMYNPELEGATNFVPGVMALVLLLVCVLMTSVSIVKEKEMGTMEVLLVSPFHPLKVILAKVFPYFVLSLLNLGIIVLLSVTLLGMPFNGSLLLLFSVSAMFIITALSLGILISNVAGSQQVAMLISMLGMMLPTIIFSGFMFPVENMPVPLQVISNLVPSKWYYIIVKDIMIKGLGFSAVWKETLILLAMTVFLLVISVRKFKVRLE